MSARRPARTAKAKPVSARADSALPTPRVYGDAERFKSLITRQIAVGTHLLDELKGVRRAAGLPAPTNNVTAVEREAITLVAFYGLAEWTQRVGSWRINVLRAGDRQLADQSERVLRRISAGLPRPTTGSLRVDDTPRVEAWLREAVAELAVDIADAVARCIVLAMDEMANLPAE